MRFIYRVFIVLSFMMSQLDIFCDVNNVEGRHYAKNRN